MATHSSVLAWRIPGMEEPGGLPRLRSGAEAGRTPCLKGGGQEESLHVRGQGECELRNLEGLFWAGQVPGILKPMNLPLWPSTSAPSKKRALSNLNCYL